MHMTSSKGLPGLRGTDHIGITAPDFDEAVDFFTHVLGLEPFYEMGPFESNEDDFMHDMLNVNPRAVIRRVKQFRCGANTNIELFEYESPDQRREMPKNSDWGGHHIALYVDDIDAWGDKLALEDKKTKLKRAFTVSVKGYIRDFLACDIIMDKENKTCYLLQKTLIKNLKENYG
jgi:catechol 2,3-dioxygenase-like lactoylglutathione lyase family enzyme